MQYHENCILAANSLSTKTCCISQTLDIEKSGYRMKNNSPVKNLLLPLTTTYSPLSVSPEAGIVCKKYCHSPWHGHGQETISPLSTVCTCM